MVDLPNQRAVREINRMLLEAVRTDWKYPHPRPENLVSPFAAEPLEYRERYFSTTDDEEDEEEVEKLTGIIGSSSTLPEKKDSDPYMFDSPDSVGGKVEERLQQRKRRKLKELEEEMKYNRGLCFFMRRRNAWTGAITREETEAMTPPTPNSSSPVGVHTPKSSSSSKDSASAEDVEPATIRDNDSAIAVSQDDATLPVPSQSDSEPQPDSDPFECPSDPSSLADVFVPLAPPIVPPSHPVRASISARSDSELYEKIVLHSRTPAVPVNLAQMTRVIVQGWKDEGNWPPKAGVLEPPIAGKRRVVKAVAVRGGGSLQNDSHRGLLANHRHLRQGVDSVKRVLRLSGNTPPPGD